MKMHEKLTLNIIKSILLELYGYDFTHYSEASFKRRLTHFQTKQQLGSLAEIIPLLLNEPKTFEQLLSTISVTVTEMFRDSEFFHGFVKTVIPKLKTYPYINIWHAGCATGEEVYSMAILFSEANYLDRLQIYGTDFNPEALSIAKKGVYPAELLRKYTQNYVEYGGKEDFSDYFVEKYEAIKIKKYLQDKVSFAKHNLTCDNTFGDMEVIICRNVMIYFDNDLKQRVLKLFYQSLVPYGFLCLGDKEKLSIPGFKCIDRLASIYQKIPT